MVPGSIDGYVWYTTAFICLKNFQTIHSHTFEFSKLFLPPSLFQDRQAVRSTAAVQALFGLLGFLNVQPKSQKFVAVFAPSALTRFSP